MTDHSLFEIPSFEEPDLGGVFHLQRKEGALCGLLLNCDDTPVGDVPACLYRLLPDGHLKPEACACSDKGGHFLLGPLYAGETYYLKIEGCSDARFYPLHPEEAERDSPSTYQKYRGIYNSEI